MPKNIFKPLHVNATTDDLEGNNGIGRYVFLPGSPGRAKEIAKRFENVTVKEHTRDHDLYLGNLTHNGTKIDVAAVASGMGCPSVEIILHELFHLGAKRFLRVGTAGSLQSAVEIGHLINVQASVRDEDTTEHYLPHEFPAIASLKFVNAIALAADKLNLSKRLHTGVVHCKSSFYAREFSIGPRAPRNRAYINLIAHAGALASEMETSALFILSEIYNYQVGPESPLPQEQVLAGCILSIIGPIEQVELDDVVTSKTIQDGIDLAIESVKILASQELTK